MHILKHSSNKPLDYRPDWRKQKLLYFKYKITIKTYDHVWIWKSKTQLINFGSATFSVYRAKLTVFIYISPFIYAMFRYALLLSQYLVYWVLYLKCSDIIIYAVLLIIQYSFDSWLFQQNCFYFLYYKFFLVFVDISVVKYKRKVFGKL